MLQRCTFGAQLSSISDNPMSSAKFSFFLLTSVLTYEPVVLFDTPVGLLDDESVFPYLSIMYGSVPATVPALPQPAKKDIAQTAILRTKNTFFITAPLTANFKKISQQKIVGISMLIRTGMPVPTTQHFIIFALRLQLSILILPTSVFLQTSNHLTIQTSLHYFLFIMFLTVSLSSSRFPDLTRYCSASQALLLLS